MDISKLLHDLRNNITYNEHGVAMITKDAVNALADIIDEQDKYISAWQQRIEKVKKDPLYGDILVCCEDCHASEAIDDLMERIAIMSEGGWINAADKKPEFRKDVWFYNPETKEVTRGYLSSENIWFEDEGDIYWPYLGITHWQYCRKPEPPIAINDTINAISE